MLAEPIVCAGRGTAGWAEHFVCDSFCWLGGSRAVRWRRAPPGHVATTMNSAHHLEGYKSSTLAQMWAKSPGHRRNVVLPDRAVRRTGCHDASAVGTRSASTSSSDGQDQANHEGGHGQKERPDGQHSTRRSSDDTADLGTESFSPAKLHSQHPNDGSDGDEDQRNDRLVASERPESPESHGDGHCDGES